MSEQTAQADSQDVASQIEAKLAALDGVPPAGDQPSEESPEERQAEEAGSDQPTEEAPPPDESEEVEYEGGTYRVPRAIKDALLRQTDYVHKTQTLADERRVVEKQLAMLQEQSAFQAEVSEEVSQLKALDAQLKSYNKIDWQGMDMETMLKTKHAYDQVKEARDEMKQALDRRSHEFRNKQSERMVQIKAEGEKVLRASIPGWGADLGKKLAEYGMQNGYTETEMAQVYDPRYVQTLWKASQWDQLQASKPQVNKRVKDAAPVPKPGAVQANQKAGQHQQALKTLKKSGDTRDAAAAFLSRTRII